MQAIETNYKGYRFRSRLEARWAVIFDWCQWQWDYEPQGYTLKNGINYLPDFYLPNCKATLYQHTGKVPSGVWVEIKGGNASSSERRKMMLLSQESKRPGIIFCGVNYTDRSYLYTAKHGDEVEMEVLDMHGYVCGHDDLTHKVTGSFYGNMIESEDALKRGARARFEHGETPSF